jgi:cell division protease FtsH
MSPAERKRIAYHECGHVLVAAALGQGGEVHRVSVVARGQGLGQATMAEEERVLFTYSDIAAQLAVAMGGMAAEEMAFGEASTAAEHDISRASALAREMVGRYGMSAEMGRLRVLSGDNGFLGADGTSMEAVSGPTMHSFDDEVRRLLSSAERTATEVLARHRIDLDAMAEALEEAETLDGLQLKRLLATVGPEMDLLSNGAPEPVTRTHKAAVRPTKAATGRPKKAPTTRKAAAKAKGPLA